MRSLILACAVALAVTLSSGLTACSYLNRPTVEALKPRDARSALSEAEILFVGVINTTDILAARGILSPAQIADMLPAFAAIAKALDDAHALVKVGEAIDALARIDFAKADLVRIADALSRANESAVTFRATPSIWQPLAI